MVMSFLLNFLPFRLTSLKKLTGFSIPIVHTLFAKSAHQPFCSGFQKNLSSWHTIWILITVEYLRMYVFSWVWQLRWSNPPIYGRYFVKKCNFCIQKIVTDVTNLLKRCILFMNEKKAIHGLLDYYSSWITFHCHSMAQPSSMTFFFKL